MTGNTLTETLIRPANHHDIPYLIDMINMTATPAMGWKPPPPEMPFANQYALELAALGRMWVATLRPSREPVGVIAWDVKHWPWNRKETYLENIHFYVHPRFRQGDTAGKLLTVFKDAADAANMPALLSINFGDEQNMELKERWVRQKGFSVRLGGSYWYAGQYARQPDLFEERV